jgi:hypothetical protein
LNELRINKGIVGRCFGEKVKNRCYFSLFRPHFEYAVSIFDPGHTEKF